MIRGNDIHFKSQTLKEKKKESIRAKWEFLSIYIYKENAVLKLLFGFMRVDDWTEGIILKTQG